MKAELHFAEAQRLTALHAYDILDTPREAEFDDIVKVVAAICEAPISVINLIDAGRQWFKAEVGLGVRETPIDSSLCAHAILQSDLFVVPDTTKDARFCDNPLVIGDPRLRFYAGALLETPEGLPLGTMCVLDYVPRDLNEKQRALLRLMAQQIMKLLDLRRLNAREHTLRLEAEALAVERAAAEARLHETATLRDQFIAVLGHDLRNSVASIDAATRLLLKTRLEDKAKGLVGMMQNSAGRMSNLIANVLDFARGKLGGGLVLDRTSDKPLLPTLKFVVDELASSNPSRAIDLRFAFADPMYCDRERIGQMFSNLLANALTHGTSDKPIVAEATENENTFTLSVSNSGPPISPAIMDELFLPFRRGDGSKQGLGLGLFIASEIARAHGGTLLVASSEQETRFTFEMPKFYGQANV